MSRPIRLRLSVRLVRQGLRWSSAWGFAVAALVLSASPARAAALWKADFETGDLSQMGKVAQELPDRIRVVSAPAPVGAGKSSLRFEIRQADIGHPNHGHKVQIDSSKLCNAVTGSELFFSFRLYIPADYPKVGKPQAIAFWRARGITPHVDPVELRIKNDREFSLHVSGAETEIWSGPYRRGVWSEIVVQARFDVSPAQGFVALWIDRKPVLARTPASTLAPPTGGGETGSGWNLGIFPQSKDLPTYVLYMDDVQCGQSFADVTGGPVKKAK